MTEGLSLSLQTTVMKAVVTSFKRTCACAAVFRAPDLAAGHCWPMPPLETPAHSQASLAQSLVRSWLLSPGSCCTQSFVCTLQESVSPGQGKLLSNPTGLQSLISTVFAVPLPDPRVRKSVWVLELS